MRLFSSLTNRIFVASAALAVLAIAVAVYRVNVAITTQADSELTRGLLEEAGMLLEQHRTTLFEHFSNEARLVADLSNLKAAVDTGDPPTVQPIAEEYQRRIKSDVLLVTDKDGRPLAQAGRLRISADDDAVRKTIGSAARGRETVALWPYPGGVLQVASIPSFVASELVGTVTVGSSLDEAALERFKALTNSEIAFALDGQVRASTLPSEFNDELAARIGASGVQRVQLGDTEYALVSRPLALANGDGSDRAPSTSLPSTTLGAGGRGTADSVIALILRSRTERLRLLNAVHRELAVTAVLAVFAATLLSYGIARTVTRPLGAITATMREMAATGDLTRRIPTSSAGRWEDEDAQLLASTFNTMTDSIGRFQREASQRERLSSLGRLSTVVAHEIRNPLMIIKMALRTLKGPNVTSEAVRAAVTDVDEEVARLDRIVSEVLDFARPIKFELAPADINALCEDAAKAVSPDGDVAPIRLDLDRSVPRIITDSERLRLALVNILTNARHAIQGHGRTQKHTVQGHGRTQKNTEERGTEGTAQHTDDLIQLRTRRKGPDRIVIEVRDRGTGIAPEHLSHVFDPYFTTRRTGTGLGLAISRNIVEGLGGTMTVTSAQGEGTEVFIELPSTGPVA